MPIDALVRVSLQSQGNPAINKALVGHAQDPVGSGPFTRVGTAAYAVRDGAEGPVCAALVDLAAALKENSSILDFASITVLRVTAPPVNPLF